MLLKLERPWFAPNDNLYSCETFPGEVEVPDGVFTASQLPSDCEVLDGKPIPEPKVAKAKAAK